MSPSPSGSWARPISGAAASRWAWTARPWSSSRWRPATAPARATPTCSAAHLPGYVVNADTIKAKGVDTIVCMAVNDAFVMGAWGKAQNAEALLMLADGNADFTKALGLVLDGSGFGLGTRSQRFAMIVKDGTVTQLNVEAGPGVDVSSAETMMGLL